MTNCWKRKQIARAQSCCRVRYRPEMGRWGGAARGPRGGAVKSGFKEGRGPDWNRELGGKTRGKTWNSAGSREKWGRSCRVEWDLAEGFGD